MSKRLNPYFRPRPIQSRQDMTICIATICDKNASLTPIKGEVSRDVDIGRVLIALSIRAQRASDNSSLKNARLGSKSSLDVGDGSWTYAEEVRLSK